MGWTVGRFRREHFAGEMSGANVPVTRAVAPDEFSPGRIMELRLHVCTCVRERERDEASIIHDLPTFQNKEKKKCIRW